MAFNYLILTHSIFGLDAQAEFVEQLVQRDVKKLLIVTDKFLHEKTKLVTELQAMCEAKGMVVTVYDDIQPNPTTKNVEDGLAVLNKSKAEMVVAFGGGSPSDSAKLIFLLKTNGGKVADYWGVNLSKKAAFPLAIINTTAGTATEVTQNAVITNTESHTKMLIVDKHIIPMIAVNNPQITVSLPKNMTAYTGMDALTHAIESYINHHNILLTDRLAALVIELINENLLVAYNEPDNMTARENMIYGEYIAGLAFNSAGLGLGHTIHRTY